MIDTSTDPQVGYRPAGDLDAATALDRYAGPFTRRNAAHLLRRFGFGGSPAELDALAALDAQTAVDRMLHPTEPEIAFADGPDTGDTLFVKVGVERREAIAWWLDRMLRTKRPFQEKMTLFWHGHFATNIAKAKPEKMVAQIDLFRQLGLGDFHTLMVAVVRDPAMLVWLDNRSNTKAHPNENFAREAMELFTLGLGQYTEDDVHAAARAFTGWGLARGVAVFRPQLHDDGQKTLLGHTGNLGADDAVAAMLASPAHPRFISRKLLEYFVYSDPEPELVDAVAARYATSGYNIAQTVGTIARSKVFFSPRAYRALPKSPVEFVVGSLRFAGVQAVPADTLTWLREMGQIPMAPPSVKGWDGGPTWINTSTLLARFNYASSLIRTPRTGAAAVAYTPDVVTHEAGGFDADRVFGVLSRDALQDDVPSADRASLVAFLDARGAAAPDPLGVENYEDRVRAALALVLNLPAYQLG